MRFLFKIFLIVFAVIALVDYCSEDPWTWQQKLAVEVQTPDGPVSGAAVSSVSWGDVNLAHNYPGGYSGEATVVDLGEGRYLFALLGDNTRYLGLRTFDAGFGADAFAAMEELSGTRIVSPENYPLLVTFGDINNPTTVKKVDPNNLAATFGAGFALTKVTLEITDEAVTEGRIEQVLNWVNDEKLLKNPTWRELPKLTKEAIRGLKKEPL